MNTSLLGRVDERGDDADDPAVAVQQRPARVAGVHGGVDLDEAGVDDLGLGVAERPLEPGDDAVAQRAVEPERVAHHERLAADLEGGGVAEDGRDDDRRDVVGLEHGDVVLLVGARDRRLGLGAVGEPDGDGLGVGDHVERGEDLGGVGDHDTRALAVVGAHVGVAALGFDEDERRPDQRVGALAAGRGRGHGLERRRDRVADVTPGERRGPRLEGRPGEHPDEHQPRAEDDRCRASDGPAAARSPRIRSLGRGIRRRRLGCWRGRLVEQVGHGDAASSVAEQAKRVGGAPRSACGERACVA